MLVAKWTAARLLFRLHLLGSIVLGLSPLLYVPATPFVLFAMAKLSSGFGALLYRDSGDSQELLSFNAVVFAAFIVALTAMSLIDWAIVRGSLLPLQISDKSKIGHATVHEGRLAHGWCSESGGRVLLDRRVLRSSTFPYRRFRRLKVGR